MNVKKTINLLLAVVLLSATLNSCDTDDSYVWYPSYPNALVTVKPVDDGAFYLQLDDKTTLFPVNVKKSPYGDKEVRALVRYDEVEPVNEDYTKSVRIHWIDSILTKKTIEFTTVDDVDKYGDDPVEIVDDWVTVAEDGYLTLRFRTRWGDRNVAHYINLLTGVNPDNPYEVEFRHNAFGDVDGMLGDALVAFNLSDLPDTNGETVKLTLKFKSFEGEKRVDFDYCSRKSTGEIRLESRPLYMSRVR